MNLIPDQSLPKPAGSAEPRTAGFSGSWPAAAGAVSAGLCILTVIFWPTAASALHLWNTSSAYNYGYLIPPIAAYLVWLQWPTLAELSPRPSPWGVVLGAGFGFGWLLADLVGLDEGRHIALVGMMQALFLSVLGWRVYRRLIFPFSYLWLMVPTGEFLLGPLQRLSHAGAVWLLELSGTPVFAEGILIQVPAGDFLVEPGCAGLNFLLASLALSLLFAKLTYARLSWRIATVAIALSVSVLANIVRIYLIIALTQWTDRKLNIADDHLLFGWGFFGVIMLALMWFGTRLGRPPEASEPSPQQNSAPSPAPSAAYFAAIALAVVAIGSLGPLASAATASGGPEGAFTLAMPDDVGPWVRTPRPIADWQPALSRGDAEAHARYEREGVAIDVSIVLYVGQRDGREAAAAGNRPAGGDGGESWIVIEGAPVAAMIADHRHEVNTAVVRRGPRSRLVAYWYESAGCITPSSLRARVCSARERLAGRAATGAFIAMATDVGDSELESARDRLFGFKAELPLTAALLVETASHGR